MIKSSLKKVIDESILAKQSLFLIEKKINLEIKEIFKRIKIGGKIFLCGKPIPSISLATDVSTITACANDYSFNDLFSRNLDALGCPKDVLIAISTSGQSKNILKALKTANKKKILSIAFLGDKGGKAIKHANISLLIKSKITARIQESHILLGHYIFEEVEKKIIETSY